MRRGRRWQSWRRIAIAGGCLALAFPGILASDDAFAAPRASGAPDEVFATVRPRSPTSQRARGHDAFFQRHHGQLPLPVKGVIAVGFGPIVDLRSGTRTAHPGLDIRAAPHTPVRAVAPGKIVHAAALRGYGNLLIVEHSGGYHSIYARLASIERAVGERVAQGEVIGATDEADAKKVSTLHFELRRHGQPLDPGDWLALP